MAVRVTPEWVTLETENPNDWCDQSYTIKRALITSVRLCKKVAGPNGPDNGIEISLTHKDVMQSRFWMRYKEFELAQADYRSLITALTETPT